MSTLQQETEGLPLALMNLIVALVCLLEILFPYSAGTIELPGLIKFALSVANLVGPIWLYFDVKRVQQYKYEGLLCTRAFAVMMVAFLFPGPVLLWYFYERLKILDGKVKLKPEFQKPD